MRPIHAFPPRIIQSGATAAKRRIQFAASRVEMGAKALLSKVGLGQAPQVAATLTERPLDEFLVFISGVEKRVLGRADSAEFPLEVYTNARRVAAEQFGWTDGDHARVDDLFNGVSKEYENDPNGTERNGHINELFACWRKCAAHKDNAKTLAFVALDAAQEARAMNVKQALKEALKQAIQVFDNTDEIKRDGTKPNARRPHRNADDRAQKIDNALRSAIEIIAESVDWTRVPLEEERNFEAGVHWCRAAAKMEAGSLRREQTLTKAIEHLQQCLYDLDPRCFKIPSDSSSEDASTVDLSQS